MTDYCDNLDNVIHYADHLGNAIICWSNITNAWIIILPGESIPTNAIPMILCFKEGIFPMVIDFMKYVKVRKGMYFFRGIKPIIC